MGFVGHYPCKYLIIRQLPDKMVLDKDQHQTCGQKYDRQSKDNQINLSESIEITWNRKEQKYHQFLQMDYKKSFRNSDKLFSKQHLKSVQQTYEPTRLPLKQILQAKHDDCNTKSSKVIKTIPKLGDIVVEYNCHELRQSTEVSAKKLHLFKNRESIYNLRTDRSIQQFKFKRSSKSRLSKLNNQENIGQDQTLSKMLAITEENAQLKQRKKKKKDMTEIKISDLIYLIQQIQCQSERHKDLNRMLEFVKCQSNQKSPALKSLCNI